MKRREFLGAAAAASLAGCTHDDDEGDNDDNGDQDPGDQDQYFDSKESSDTFTAAKSDHIDRFVQDIGNEVDDYNERLNNLNEKRDGSDVLPLSEEFSWTNRQTFSPTDSTVFYDFSGDQSIQLETQGRTYKSAPGTRPFGAGDRDVGKDLASAFEDLSLFDDERSARNFLEEDLDNPNLFQDLRNFIGNMEDTQPYFRHFGDNEELTVEEGFTEDVVDDLNNVIEEVEEIEDDYRALVDDVAEFNDNVDEGVNDFLGYLDETVDEGDDDYSDNNVSKSAADQYRRTLINKEQGVDELYSDIIEDAAEVILTKRLYKDARDQAKEVLPDLESDLDDDEGPTEPPEGDPPEDDPPDEDPDPAPEPDEPEYEVEKRRIFKEDEIYDPIKDQDDGNLDDYDEDDLLEEFRDRLEDKTGWEVSDDELFNGELDPTEVETIDLRWEQTRFGDIKNVGVRYTFEFEEEEGQFTTDRVPQNDYINLGDDFGEDLVEYVTENRVT